MSAAPVLAARPQDHAAVANRELSLFMEASSRAAQHAIAVGDALLSAREMVPRGQWEQWLADNFDGSRTMAFDCMRFARNREHIPSDAGYDDARKLVRGLAAVGGYTIPAIGEDTKQRARELRARGEGYQSIADALDVSVSTLHRWFNGPNAKERRVKERKLAEAAARQQQIRAAVRREGGAIAELYAMAERMQDLIGRAQREASGREGRAHLSLAGEYHRKMRDEIVRALGVA